MLLALVALRRVLSTLSAQYICALPNHNKVLVHAEGSLLSYSMDLLARVSQGNSPPAALGASMEKVSGSDTVIVARAGIVKERTVGSSLSHNLFHFLLMADSTHALVI